MDRNWSSGHGRRSIDPLVGRLVDGVFRAALLGGSRLDYCFIEIFNPGTGYCRNNLFNSPSAFKTPNCYVMIGNQNEISMGRAIAV